MVEFLHQGRAGQDGSAPANAFWKLKRTTKELVFDAWRVEVVWVEGDGGKSLEVAVPETYAAFLNTR